MSASTKDRILDAAQAVVLERGAAHLTLDAVAEQAGISKGGLLYHFPAKDQLLEGMIVRLSERMEARRAEIIAQLPPSPVSPLKGAILALLSQPHPDDKLKAALLAVIANEPRLMVTVREYHKRRFASYAPKGAGWLDKALLLLAGDGLFLLELLQVSPFDAHERRELLEALLRNAEDVGARTPAPD